MRLSGIRLPILAAAAWAGISLTVYAADLRYGETIYLSPTTATVSLGPAYVASRPYVVATDYVVPSYIPTSASYVATSYYTPTVSLLPTTYLETTYRRGLFGRRWVVERPVFASYGVDYVPTSYVVPRYYPSSLRISSYRPTVWQYPTVLETTYAAPATICCDEVGWAAPAVPSSSPTIRSSSPAGSVTSRPSESAIRDDPTIPSNVDEPPDDAGVAAAPLPDNAKTKAQPVNPADRGDSPPTPPPAGRDQTKSQVDANKNAAAPARNDAAQKAVESPATKPKPVTPTAPAGDQDNENLLPAPGANDSETTRRDSRKAIYSTRSRRLDRRNILFGTVESDTGAPRGEVAVTVVSRNNSFVHHDGISNAFGNFAIPVPDGQWTVKVTMPSGSVETVSYLTVTNGKVVDNREYKEVYNLHITF